LYKTSWYEFTNGLVSKTGKLSPL